MSIIFEERSSDSLYIDRVTHGWTTGVGSVIRPSEFHWHMVFTRHQGCLYPIFVGPLTTAGVVSYTEGAEILWVTFSLGAFMPHLPPRDYLNTETILPGAASQSFWLKSSVWQLPDYDTVEPFVDRLVREGVLVYDPVVSAVLHGRPQAIASRTLRYRFLRATGLTQLHIYQAERAQRAEALLQQGVSIIDAVYELGYFDQPHMTRALKQFVGRTPGKIIQTSVPG
jgi:hypothetical protein